MVDGTSNNRHRFFTPNAFKAGEIASVIAPNPRDASATTSGVVKGSTPKSAHSTEA